MLGILFAVLAFLGYSNLSSIREDVKIPVLAELKDAISTQIDETYKEKQSRFIQEALSQTCAEMDSKIAFVQFSALANELNKREESFTNSERDAVLSLLEQAIKSPAASERAAFVSSVEHLINTFFKADLAEEIDNLDDILGEVMLSKPGIVFTMATHYGHRVAGEAKLSESTGRRFNKYAKTAYKFGAEAAVLPYQIALEFRKAENKRNTFSGNYIQDAGAIVNKDHQKAFVITFKIMPLAIVISDSSATLVRAGQTFKALNLAYDLELRELESKYLGDGGEFDEPNSTDVENILQLFERTVEQD